MGKQQNITGQVWLKILLLSSKILGYGHRKRIRTSEVYVSWPRPHQITVTGECSAGGWPLSSPGLRRPSWRGSACVSGAPTSGPSPSPPPPRCRRPGRRSKVGTVLLYRNWVEWGFTMNSFSEQWTFFWVSIQQLIPNSLKLNQKIVWQGKRAPSSILLLPFKNKSKFLVEKTNKNPFLKWKKY